MKGSRAGGATGNREPVVDTKPRVDASATWATSYDRPAPCEDGAVMDDARPNVAFGNVGLEVDTASRSSEFRRAAGIEDLAMQNTLLAFLPKSAVLSQRARYHVSKTTLKWQALLSPH